MSSTPRSRWPAPGRARMVAAVLVLAPGALLASVGCSGGGDGSSDRLQVVAGAYPLAWVAEQVGGERVEVENLTAPGAEPHDLELTPRQVAHLAEADLVLRVGGFQPSLDDAVDDVAADRSFDAADHTDLLPVSGAEAGERRDPHFWLDPTRLGEVAVALGERLAAADPAHADELSARAERVARRLRDLDGELRAGLADCRSRDLVTSHTAFRYLADRYGFEEVGIAGLDAASEPSPAALADLVDLVRARGVLTVYSETLVSPAVAEALAGEAGVDTAVLDPLEGLSDRSAGADYPAVMRADLRVLRKGQGCR